MKRLSSHDWVKIKTEYQFGEKSIRQIAGENGITDGAIRAKIKAEGWTQEIREQVIDIKKNIEEIAQVITHEQKPYAMQKIKTLFDTQLEAMGYVKDIAITSLKMHKNLNAQINNHAAKGQRIPLHIAEAISLLKAQGLDVHGSMKSLGIGVKDSNINDTTGKDDSPVQFYLPKRND